MAHATCPYCCRTSDFTTSFECPSCRQEIPPLYVREYHRTPPLWLMTVGFPQHGKTTYLAALTLLLENLAAVFPEVWYRPAGTHTFDTIQQMRQEALDGKLPESTQVEEDPERKGLLRPLLLQVHEMPELGSRCLVLYDVPGESFDALGRVGQSAPALKKVNTVWFLVSLPDLERRAENEPGERRAITDLFNVYLTGMEQLKVDVRGWDLIVVYTKSDKAAFPPEIRAYLTEDRLTDVARGEPAATAAPPPTLAEYLAEMAETSRRLEEHTRLRVRYGALFLNMVRAAGMNVVFTVTSALGQGPDHGARRLDQGAMPRRVLDPLLWAMKLERKLPSRTFRLVLDAYPGCEEMYTQVPLAELWDRLGEHGEVTSHFLGQARPASVAGQPPPAAAPGRARQRLIGPILERSAPDDRVLVLTAGPILDLDDYRGSAWSDRLLVVETGSEPSLEWPQAVTCRPGDDVGPLIDSLLGLES